MVTDIRYSQKGIIAFQISYLKIVKIWSQA